MIPNKRDSEEEFGQSQRGRKKLDHNISTWRKRNRLGGYRAQLVYSDRDEERARKVENVTRTPRDTAWGRALGTLWIPGDAKRLRTELGRGKWKRCNAIISGSEKGVWVDRIVPRRIRLKKN